MKLSADNVAPGCLPDPYQLTIICDYPHCRSTPMRAVRIVVPAKTPNEAGHFAMRARTDTHCCDRHRETFKKIDDHLTLTLRLDFQRLAKKHRPHGFQCDFDQAFVEYELISTPEYRRFLAYLRFASLPALAAFHAGERYA